MEIILLSRNLQGIDFDSSDEEWEAHIRDEYGRHGRARLLREAATETDVNVDMAGLVHNTFNRYDNLARVAVAEHEVNTESEHAEGRDDVQPEDGEFVDLDGETMTTQEETSPAERILEESSHISLFAGSRLSSLAATMILLQACRTHKCTRAFITELFTILKNSVLPEINTLPPNEYAATKLLQKLGLKHEDIHVCPNNCMLFRFEHSHAENCTRLMQSSSVQTGWCL